MQARGSLVPAELPAGRRAGVPPLPERIDHYRTFGGGIGYRVGRDIRVGFNIDSFHRDSIVASQAYDGVRGGMAVTYVLK